MRRLTLFVSLALAMTFAMNAFADDGDDIINYSDIRGHSVHWGGSPGMAKAVGDTVYLIGPAGLNPVVIGTFQDGSGQADWNGWTTMDWTVPDLTDTTWHASTYFAINGTYSGYCGDETLPSCGPGDPAGGYGNSWNLILEWRATVADNQLSTSINVGAAVDVDSENGYDWAIIARELDNETFDTIWQLSGDSTAVVSVPVTYAVGEYIGDNLDEIAVSFIGNSDGGWSDQDCEYPSSGLFRIDDVTITMDNPSTSYSHDFEDGTLGNFQRKFLGAVGDFTHLASGLGDPDICISNGTPQVCFLDDGVVVPETFPGSFATADNRKYAMGFVVNYTGGVTFNEDRHMRNSAVSPVIPWQDQAHDGAQLGYTFMSDSFFLEGEAGVFMEWLLRSTAGDAASIENAAWQHSPFVYTGGPNYGRQFWDVTGNLAQGRTFVQMMVGASEIAYVWGLDGHNGSPSPYFDNIRLETFPFEGPAFETTALRLAQDSFPEIGIIDTVDLGRNSVRFDMAQNISPTTHEWYHNGDSITIDVLAVRDGAALTGNPRMHWTMQRNPLFDPYRLPDLDWPAAGSVVMDTCYGQTGLPIADRFAVDMPDTGFLFPGDVLHYYFSAEDAIGGAGGTAPFTSVLPDPTTYDYAGWGNFDDMMAWTEDYTVRGLPTVVPDEGNPGAYTSPSILFWDDSEGITRFSKNEWYSAWTNLGLEHGVDFDIYYGKAPSSGIGTGISRRATTNQLAWYGDLVYTTGYLNTATLSNGDWGNGGDDDITRLENWLDIGGKDMFLTGNNLAFDLANSGGATSGFLNNRMLVTFVDKVHRDLVDGQLAPRVLITNAGSNPVFSTVTSWIAFGGCPQLWEIDLVNTTGAGQRLALFANASGTDGGYTYSPVTLAVHGNGSRIITMTQDLAYAETDPDEGAKANATLGARVRILKDILNYFGVADRPGNATDVPDAREFAVSNYPNPFNPTTKIAYTIVGPGHMTMKVFNVRGELVKTLIDGHVEADGYVDWDGSNNQGGKVSSGVYFYQAQMGNLVQINKMALVK